MSLIPIPEDLEDEDEPVEMLLPLLGSGELDYNANEWYPVAQSVVCDDALVKLVVITLSVHRIEDQMLFQITCVRNVGTFQKTSIELGLLTTWFPFPDEVGKIIRILHAQAVNEPGVEDMIPFIIAQLQLVT